MKLGNILHGPARRDAIHVAIAPIEAAEPLARGERFRMGSDGKAHSIRKDGWKYHAIGIVDPWLPDDTVVQPGQRFYGLINEDEVKTLRHEWTHHAFPDTDAPPVVPARPTTAEVGFEESFRWIDDYATAYLNISGETLINGARRHISHDERLVGGVAFEGEIIPDEFWDHYEIVTGRRVHPDKRYSFLSCAC